MIDAVEVTVRQPAHADRTVTLREGATRIGRAEDNELVLSDRGVSRRHARLLLTHDTVRVEDLGSGNGTYFKGVRVETTQDLKDGDELVIDPFVLVFRVRGTPRRASMEDPTLRAAPPMQTGARVDLMSSGSSGPMSFAITTNGLTVGRSENRDIVLTDPAASRHHCSFLTKDGQFFLRDMSSANGTFVNGQRVRDVSLADGDRVRIGNTELRFALNDATLADSNTERLALRGKSQPVPFSPVVDPWAEDGDLILPVPAASTPARPRSRLGAIVGGLGLALAVATTLAALFLVVVVAGVAALVFLPRENVVQATPQHPPAWTLNLESGLPPTALQILFDDGVKALHDRNSRKALASFYRALQADPGNPAAERLAYASAEFVVLDALRPSVEAAANAEKARAEKRDALIARTEERGAPGVAAKEELEKEFREDPVAIAAMRWSEGPQAQRLTALAADAQKQVDAGDWVAAEASFAEVFARAKAPDLKERGRVGLEACRKQLARAVASSWTAGVRAESNADLAAARNSYAEVLVQHPANPSARVRLDRLGGELPSGSGGP